MVCSLPSYKPQPKCALATLQNNEKWPETKTGSGNGNRKRDISSTRVVRTYSSGTRVFVAALRWTIDTVTCRPNEVRRLLFVQATEARFSQLAFPHIADSSWHVIKVRDHLARSLPSPCRNVAYPYMLWWLKVASDAYILVLSLIHIWRCRRRG